MLFPRTALSSQLLQNILYWSFRAGLRYQLRMFGGGDPNLQITLTIMYFLQLIFGCQVVDHTFGDMNDFTSVEMLLS